MTSTVAEACREVFQERSREEERREREDRSGTQASDEQVLVMDLDDDAIEREEQEIDSLIKRHRESMTPPSREEKRKKQEGEIAQPVQEPSMPQRQTKRTPAGAAAEATGARPKIQEETQERSRDRKAEKQQKEATQQPRSTASSTSSQQSQPDTITTK